MSPTTNLPAPVTELIGRDHAVQKVRELLAAGRLVTITGPGGVGKTSVAIVVGRAMVDSYPDGAWLVDLTAWDGCGDSAELILSVLSIRDTTSEDSASERLAGALRERQMLLVLDNCEHVAGPVAELVGALLPAAPGLRVLTTGREPLRLRGEARLDLPPLGIPDTDDPARLAQSSAVRLFPARAGLAPTPETVTGVAEVCRRLDGIPLALEFAAAEQGLRSGEVFATISLAFAARRDGKLDLAEEHLRWLLASARQQQTDAGHPPYLSMVLVELGLLAGQQGDPAAALARHREGFDVFRDQHSASGMAWALTGMAAALAPAGRSGLAAELDRITAAVRAAEPNFAAQFAAGTELTLEQARSRLGRDRA